MNVYIYLFNFSFKSAWAQKARLCFQLRPLPLWCNFALKCPVTGFPLLPTQVLVLGVTKCYAFPSKSLIKPFAYEHNFLGSGGGSADDQPLRWGNPTHYLWIWKPKARYSLALYQGYLLLPGHQGFEKRWEGVEVDKGKTSMVLFKRDHFMSGECIPQSTIPQPT